MSAEPVTGISIVHLASGDGTLIVVLAYPLQCPCGRTATKWNLPLDAAAKNLPAWYSTTTPPAAPEQPRPEPGA